MQRKSPPYWLRYSLLIVTTVLLLIFSFEDIGKKASLTYCLLASILITIDLSISKRWLGNSLLFIGTLFYFCCTTFEIGHSLLFNDRISSSVFYIIFETNMGESFEFLQSTFSWKEYSVLSFLIIAFTISSIAIFKGRKPLNLTFKRWINIKVNYWIMLVFIALLLATKAAFFPVLFFHNLQKYKQEKEELVALSSNKLGGDFAQVSHQSNSEKETYVLVIGESTTRRCMGLYDYYRPTNPLLQAIAHNLKVYPQVVSPHTHTMLTLDKVLTLRSFKDSTIQHTGSILQLFNHAGFTTYWISNQKPIGLYESSVTALSNAADHRVFVNVASNQLDEKLFLPYQNALDEDQPKKLIILHLMGTHLKYDKRYPKQFDRFSSQPKTQFNHKQAWTTINHYDNAICYNDFIISTFIEKLEQQAGRSFLLYFSDHGEEVYHDKNFALHAEYDDTKDMYDIPFILWSTKEIQNNPNYSFDITRKYNTEDLLYSMANLAQIDFNLNDSTRSIFSTAFTFRKRYITDKKIYDEIYP